MPKFKKKSNNILDSKKKKLSAEEYTLKSLRITVILSGLFLIFSLLFNTEIVTIFMKRDIYWDILDVSFKVSLILLGFLFMMISLGNFKELTGNPVNLKEILLLTGLSLSQTWKNLYVFIFTSIGLVILLFYLYLIQEK
jgi:hypothetical protein